MFDYTAKVVDVHDGDTVTLDVDLGFGIVRRDRFRLFGPDPSGQWGINAPELPTPEGKAARVFLFDKLTAAGGGVVRVQTVKDRREKFGRYLAVLIVEGVNVNQLMIDARHARLVRY